MKARRPVSRPAQSSIWMIGSDAALTYLIRRFAEQGGFRLDAKPAVPPLEAVREKQPAAILFPSIESMETAARWIEALAGHDHDVSILVCSSVTDQARARELGADACLLHPLTYEGFLSALSATRPSK